MADIPEPAQVEEGVWPRHAEVDLLHSWAELGQDLQVLRLALGGASAIVALQLQHQHPEISNIQILFHTTYNTSYFESIPVLSII